MLVYILLSVSVFVGLTGVFLYFQGQRIRKETNNRELNLNRQMYELAILKELGDRTGYSLDIHEILDIITGSLHQFIEYSAVSYMIIRPEKVLFKIHLEKSVHPKFIHDVRQRMINSLSALLNDEELNKKHVDEILSGAILIEELDEPVSSFFNIPIVIGGTVAGVLTVADTRAGLYKEAEMTILYKITQQASKAVSKLQEVIEIEQRKLNSMVESISEGVVMTDNDYRIVVANPAVRAIVGLENKKDISIFDFIENLGGKLDLRGKLEESIKLSKNIQLDDVLIKDRFYQIFFSPVMSNSGTVSKETLGGVVIFHDTTHEREVEELRKDFTSMMVHELRSPLDGINKITDLIIRKKSSLSQKEIFKEYIPIIHKSSSDMLGLVNNLLDAAKVESGKYEVFRSMNSLIDILNERVKFYESAAKAASVKLVANISKDIPTQVSLDSGAISSVLNNLISNAIRYTGAGGEVSVQAFVHAKAADIVDEAKKSNVKWQVKKDDVGIANLPDSVIVAVTDTGVGIKKENLPKLFNKFKQFQSSAAAADKKGSGLGLVIAKGIIEAHQGTISVGSEEGSGTTFYFWLPILQ